MSHHKNHNKNQHQNTPKQGWNDGQKQLTSGDASQKPAHHDQAQLPAKQYFHNNPEQAPKNDKNKPCSNCNNKGCNNQCGPNKSCAKGGENKGHQDQHNKNQPGQNQKDKWRPKGN